MPNMDSGNKCDTSSYPWTYARLEMPSVHAAMGLFHEIVSLPEAVPAAVLWEAVWADKAPWLPRAVQVGHTER